VEDCVFACLWSRDGCGGGGDGGDDGGDNDDDGGSRTLVSFAIFTPYHDSLYISSLCTSPPLRNLGYGTLLLRFANGVAVGMGLGWVCGTVEAGNGRAMGVYERLGRRRVSGVGSGGGVRSYRVFREGREEVGGWEGGGGGRKTRGELEEVLRYLGFVGIVGLGFMCLGGIGLLVGRGGRRR